MKENSANMGQYIDVDLTRLYNLDLSTKEKPVMNVDDVFPSPSPSLGHGHCNFPQRATTITGCFPGSDDRIHRESTRRIGIRGTK
jgi:hypothetical protein